MARYIHEQDDWPRFRWDEGALAERLSKVRYEQGRLNGLMGTLGLPLQQEALAGALGADVVASSGIEGEKLDALQVRSSLARRLGLDAAGLPPPDRKVEGVVEMMLDATQRYDVALDAQRLQAWHELLFPTGRSGMHTLTAGSWRDDRGGPMQVVSGPLDRERVHFEAPAAARLEKEVTAFLQWFNGNAHADWLVSAGLAHLWFVTIHPFEDGNGRIARAVADLALCRSELSPRRFYSVAAQIQRERDEYYTVLELTQKGSLDVTAWLSWFLERLEHAVAGAEVTLQDVLAKARFWGSVRGLPLNDRQNKVLRKLLDGFEGKLTTTKWAKLAGCSHDTALRDIQALTEQGVLVQGEGGGRSTHYTLVER